MNEWQNAISDLQEACRDTFGTSVRYIPSVEKRPGLGGEAIEITGVFDDHRETINLMAGGGGGMETVIPRPVVEIRLADLGIDAQEGDEVMIGDITYRILDVQADGHGAAVLVLNRNQEPF